MPVEVNFVDDGAGVEVICSGELRGEEIIKTNRKIYGLPGFLNLRYQFVNLSRVEKTSLTPDQVRAIAKQDIDASANNPRMAVIVAGDSDIVYAFSRMWLAYVEKSPWETKVFRSSEEARKWIDRHIMRRESAEWDENGVDL